MVDNPAKKTHEFGEAFMLMWYMCHHCSHKELLWNSRDGVIPFGHPCPKCDHGDMFHTSWEQDCYAPDHFPTRGQGVWVDMPRSLVPVIVRGIVNVYGDDVPPDLVIALTKNYGPGTPWLLRWR